MCLLFLCPYRNRRGRPDQREGQYPPLLSALVGEALEPPAGFPKRVTDSSTRLRLAQNDRKTGRLSPFIRRPERAQRVEGPVSPVPFPVPQTIPAGKQKKRTSEWMSSFFGDPYGNRTHVTAVKGRCLNRLTNGPGSGDLT